MLSWQLQLSPLPDATNDGLLSHALTCPVLPCPATSLDDDKHVTGSPHVMATPKACFSTPGHQHILPLL